MTNNKDELSYIEEYYRFFWIYTMDKYNENKQKTGIYFWIKKKDDYYALFSYGENGLNIRLLKIDDLALTYIENLLKQDGFEITTTERNNKLLLIKKDAIEKKYIQMEEHKNEISPVKTRQ